MSQQLDGLLGMLCVDVAPADGASIQQTLKLLEEKLKSVGKQNTSAFQINANECITGKTPVIPPPPLQKRQQKKYYLF